MSDDDFVIVTRKRSVGAVPSAYGDLETRRGGNSGSCDDELHTAPVCGAEALARLKRIAEKVHADRAKAGESASGDAAVVTERINRRLQVLGDVERQHSIVAAESRVYLENASLGVYDAAIQADGLVAAVNGLMGSLDAWRSAEHSEPVPAETEVFCARARSADALVPILEGVYVAHLCSWDVSLGLRVHFDGLAAMIPRVSRGTHEQLFVLHICKRHAVPFLATREHLDGRAIESIRVIEQHLSAHDQRRLVQILSRFAL